LREAAWKRPIPEERLLLRDLTHGVNNDFAAAIGILSLVAARSPSEDVQVALAAVEEHLYALKLKRTVASASEYVQPLAPKPSTTRARTRGCLAPRKGEFRGGLAAWQERIVSSHIEEHLASNISIATLAGLARLSTHHFCRAFKQSFGMPPHRYHMARRIQRAKILLMEQARSVTEIGLDLGFSETSSFSALFRRLTGQTPSAFRRRVPYDETRILRLASRSSCRG
jgi:AraC-like DNA-binding protein